MTQGKLLWDLPRALWRCIERQKSHDHVTVWRFLYFPITTFFLFFGVHLEFAFRLRMMFHYLKWRPPRASNGLGVFGSIHATVLEIAVAF